MKLANPVNATRPQALSIHLVKAELIRRGYTAADVLLNRRYVKFTAPTGWVWLTPYTAVSYPFMPHPVRHICRDKQSAAAFARARGVTVPRAMLLGDNDDAANIEAFVASCGTIVVKPLDSYGGKGVTLDVTYGPALEQAIAKARSRSRHVLLQQQVRGDEVRLTILDGAVVSVLHRATPGVIGDGAATVEQLIARENQARRLLHFEHITYPQLDETLIPADLLRSSYIPKQGELVTIGQSTLVCGGASLYDISQAIHPSYIETALGLAQELNPEFLVVDMMIEDYRRLQTPDNYAFIEFNTSPSLLLYYGEREGKVCDITAKLADMIDQMSSSNKNVQTVKRLAHG